MPPMNPHPRFFRLSIACGLFPLVVGCVVLFGWWQGIASLIRIHPHFAAMQPLTATGMVLSGIGVVSVAARQPPFAWWALPPRWPP